MWRVIGQSKALSTLERGLESGTLPHAHLFVGPSHVGKGTLAVDLAQALNCLGDNPPCGECQSCRRIIAGKHADVRIIGLNADGSSKGTKTRSEIGIDDIRDLQQSASLPPYEGRCKVFIIDGAERLSAEAANCLLKVLEEPPPSVAMVLLTCEERNLFPTVISRCRRVELKPVPVAEVERVLAESRGVDGDKARLLARLSEGCIGWALAALTDDNLLAQRTQRLSKLLSLFTAGLGERFDYAAELATQFEKDRRSGGEVIRLWVGWWRDLMLAKCGCAYAITNLDYALSIERWAQTFDLFQIKNFINALHESLEQIYRNANSHLVLETLMLSMPRGGNGAQGL